MLLLQGLHYAHPNKDVLFTDIHLVINKYQKIALVGNNGTGKSTLLKILAGQLSPSSGTVHTDRQPYYVPQIYGQTDQTVAQALKIDGKLNALTAILNGNVTDEDLATLDDDWELEHRCAEAFSQWGLSGIGTDTPLTALSGGQKTKVFLAGITIHQAELVLLDEPSNHLDEAGRWLLYEYIRTTRHTLLVVSHDHALLNLLHTVNELSSRGSKTYSGNFDHYREQKELENGALKESIDEREKALRKAKEAARTTAERQQKLDTRGKKKQAKAGMPKIMMNTMRNKAENSTSRLAGVHTEKTERIATELSALRKELPLADSMKMDLTSKALHYGKLLVEANGINFDHGNGRLWAQPLSFQIRSGERVAIKGANGSGKTTLVRLILGDLLPTSGLLKTAVGTRLYIDQEYTIIDDRLTVYEHAQNYNTRGLEEHEIRIRLDRFLFSKDTLNKPCRELSGGEKMRLTLCSLTIKDQQPDMILLDEPTNNLDLQNIALLTSVIAQYRGTLLVISHDRYFLEQVNVNKEITL